MIEILLFRAEEDNISIALRAEQIKRRLTQAQLARVIGIPPATVSRIINGKAGKLHGPTAAKVAAFLGWPPERMARAN